MSFSDIPNTQFQFRNPHNDITTRIAKVVLKNEIGQKTKALPDDKQLDQILSLTKGIDPKKARQNKQALKEIALSYYEDTLKNPLSSHVNLADQFNLDLKTAHYLNDQHKNSMSISEFETRVFKAMHNPDMHPLIVKILENICKTIPYNGLNIEKNQAQEIKNFTQALQEKNFNHSTLSQETYQKLGNFFNYADEVYKNGENPIKIYLKNLL